MIITRTPLRISFVGGGTDLPAFYSLEPGAVLSTTINKYMWVILNPKFDGLIRLSYTTTENVAQISEIRHEIIRNALKMLDFDLSDGLEIATISDVPARGTGLGSSSALAVGLVNALMTMQKKKFTREELAALACRLEIILCDKPIGKQDQYASAFGGMNMFRFYPDGEVEVLPVPHAKRTLGRLINNLLLLYLGQRMQVADDILEKQGDMDRQKLQILRRMADLAEKMYADLYRDSIHNFGDYLHENWMLKKQLVSSISNPEIDEIYEKTRREGAKGGKLLGAGGGGFLLFHAHPELHNQIVKHTGLRKVEFDFDFEGSKLILPMEK